MKKQWMMIFVTMMFAFPGLGMAQDYAYNYIIKVPVELKNLRWEVGSFEVRCDNREKSSSLGTVLSEIFVQGPSRFDGTVSVPVKGLANNPSLTWDCTLLVRAWQNSLDLIPTQATHDKNGFAIPVWAQAKKGAFFRSTTTITSKGRKL